MFNFLQLCQTILPPHYKTNFKLTKMPSNFFKSEPTSSNDSRKRLANLSLTHENLGDISINFEIILLC